MLAREVGGLLCTLSLSGWLSDPRKRTGWARPVCSGIIGDVREREKSQNGNKLLININIIIIDGGKRRRLRLDRRKGEEMGDGVK